jgi:hypothetical protein
VGVSPRIAARSDAKDREPRRGSTSRASSIEIRALETTCHRAARGLRCDRIRPISCASTGTARSRSGDAQLAFAAARVTSSGSAARFFLHRAQQKCQSVRQRSRDAPRLGRLCHVSSGIRRFPLELTPRRSASQNGRGWGPGFGLDPSVLQRSSALPESPHTRRSPGDLRSRAEGSAFDPRHGPPRKPTDSFRWMETLQGAP